MSTLTDWAKRHQLISFFILSFAISWGLLISLGPIYASGVVIVVPMLMLALFGPALAGIILSGVIHPKPRQAALKTRFLAFFLTWLVATPVFVLIPDLSRQGIGISSGLVVIAAASGVDPVSWTIALHSLVPFAAPDRPLPANQLDSPVDRVTFPL